MTPDSHDAAGNNDATLADGRPKVGGYQVDFLDGTVNHVQIDDRALPKAEVQTLYDSGR